MEPNRAEYFPPVWIMSQKWEVEYFFEQKAESITGHVASTLAGNYKKRQEVWMYQVYGREMVNGRTFLVIRVTPKGRVEQEGEHDEFQIYFDEQSRTIHSIKARTHPTVGDPQIEYVKNPWGVQSFFSHDPLHLILDWPLLDSTRVQKEVGMGKISFVQKDFFDRGGLIVEMAHPKANTVMTWQRGKPWWVFADKVIKLPGHTLHIQAKLIEPKEKQQSPF